MAKSRSKISISQWTAVVVVAGLLCGSMAWGKGPWFFGKKKSKATPVVESQEPQPKTCRLNYLIGAGWNKVLNQVASDHGLTMVMDRVPRGRFIRRDRTDYSLADAMRILNKELEQKEFRLVRQGDFLVLMHLRSARPRYQRPLAPEKNTRAWEPSDPTQIAGSAGYRSESHTIRSGGNPQSEPSRYQHQPADGSALQQVGHEEDKDTKLSVIPITPRNRTALQLSRRLYSAFLSHSELIDAGPEGLPAFRVYNRPMKPEEGPTGTVPAGERLTRFTVGIDTKGNRILIEAPGSTAQALVRMVRMLDVAKKADEPDIRVKHSERDARTVARRVRPVIQELVQREQVRKPQDRKQVPQTNERTLAQAQQPVQPRNAQPQPQPAQPGQPGLPGQVGQLQLPTEALLGGLKGEVKIEVLPDGRLVVIGNQEDVDKVLTLIDLLETGVGQTVPDLTIVFLKHVNSDALATLLTDVYSVLGSARQQAGQRATTVTIVSLVKPNAVIIMAPDSDVDAIVALAEELDQPVDPETEFEVFHIEHGSASQIALLLEDLYEERTQRPGLATRIVVYPDVRTNSIVVQARPRDLKEIEALVRQMDRDSSKAVNQLRVFVLKHAVAEELAETMNVAIQSVINPAQLPQGAGAGGFGGGGVGGAQAAQALRDVRSAVIELLPETGTKDARVVSGILADIRVNPDPRTNSLVVTAPEQSMKMMEQLIKRLDKPTSVVADIKHFMLENADATSVSDLLTQLFVADTGQDGQLGVQVAGAEDASSSIVPLRFSVDVRTNSIFAVGGREALEVVEAVVARLDQSDIRLRDSKIYLLKNSPATDVANAINQFLQSQRDLQQIDPDLVSAFEQIEREVIVVAEPFSNALIISASPRYFDEIEKMIIELDRTREQVTIQALIVEVELNNTDEFGIELGFQDSVLFNRGTVANIQSINTTTQGSGNDQVTTQEIVSSDGLPGFNFNRDILGNNTLGDSARPGKVGSQGLSNFGVGRVNGDLGFGGLVMSAGSESVNILLRALSENRKVEILSRPMIQALHNQLAQITVGQVVPRVTGLTTNPTTGVSNPTVSDDNVGITLTVTPRVSPDGMVVMEVIAEKSSLSPQGGITLISDFQTGNTIESPIVDIAEARASVSVRDGQTIVLGGMITRTESTIERKVPGLGDLPVLGAAFRFDSHSVRRTELLIFLTPQVMRTDAAFDEQKRVESDRLHFMAEQAEEIHGPIYSAPREADPDLDTLEPAEQPTPAKEDADARSAPKPDSPLKSKKIQKSKKGKKRSTQKKATDDQGAQADNSTYFDGSAPSDAELFSLPSSDAAGFSPGEPVKGAGRGSSNVVGKFFRSLVP